MKTTVTLGEIMLRLKPPEFQRIRQAQQLEVTFGGGEANVAAAMAQWGVPVEYVTRLPQNEWGDACLAYLRSVGVGVKYILRGGDRLGIYFLEAGTAQRHSSVIYDRANSSFATLKKGMVDWKAVFEGCGWLHWTGITPAISEDAAVVCSEALEAARNQELTISCDLNYRARLWQWTKTPGDVMEDLVRYCDVILGNEEDAAKVFDIHAPEVNVDAGQVQADKYRSVCESLSKRFPGAKAVAITLRGSLSASHNTWGGVLWTSNKFLEAPIYDILPVADRMGAGDAFAAGLIYGMQTKPNDPVYALNFAAASGCLKHTISGDFNRVTVSEVEAVMKGDVSGRVSR